MSTARAAPTFQLEEQQAMTQQAIAITHTHAHTDYLDMVLNVRRARVAAAVPGPPTVLARRLPARPTAAVVARLERAEEVRSLGKPQPAVVVPLPRPLFHHAAITWHRLFGKW